MKTNLWFVYLVGRRTRVFFLLQLRIIVGGLWTNICRGEPS